jgi:hypothetical protein
MTLGTLPPSERVFQLVKNEPEHEISATKLITYTEGIELSDLALILRDHLKSGRLKAFRRENDGIEMNWYRAIL